MMDQRGSTASSVAFLVLLLVLLGASLYLLFLNWPSEPVSLITVNGNAEEEIQRFANYSTSKQFYENMRFRDKRISYRIESACDVKKVDETQEAFSILESRTALDFYPASRSRAEDAEITIFCSDIAPEAEQEGFFVAGEGGPTEVINLSLYGVILSGKVSFFREEKCERPNIALHEILHVLGFDHNDNPNSIMFPTLNCDQTVDQSILDDINRLYSIESSPDLMIAEIDAAKSGRYLGFDIGVVNQGLQDAENVVLSVYADGKFVKEFDLETLGVGITKILEVENLKISRSTDEVTFIVDEGNDIDEIFENNNERKLVVSVS